MSSDRDRSPVENGHLNTRVGRRQFNATLAGGAAYTALHPLSEVASMNPQTSPQLMNAPKKYVVSKTLDKPIWRDTTIIRDNVIESIRALKAQPGKTIATDGSSQLVHALLLHDLVDELHLTLYPLSVGSGKRVLPKDLHATFTLTSAKPYPSGVVGLQYVRQR